MLLFMLLTGQPPFEGDDEAAITESIQRNKIIFEKKFWADKTEAKILIKNMLASAHMVAAHSQFRASTLY